MTSTANAIKVKSSTSKWKRVVLKLSGMAFAGIGAQNVEPEVFFVSISFYILYRLSNCE